MAKLIEPFDYIELVSGELVCAMWYSRTRLMTGYVIYVPAAGGTLGPARSFRGRDYEKLYWRKDKTEHDRYVARRRLPSIDDPIGGLMVTLPPHVVRRVWSCRGAIEAMQGDLSPADISATLKFLGTSSAVCGITGSSLLDGRLEGRDLDFIIYDSDSTALTARRIRELVNSSWEARLPGHWGRPWHHRRFRLQGVEVCPKIPLPQRILDELPVPNRLQRLFAFGRVVGTRFAHCLPAAYDIELLGNAPRRISVFSADSSHSMAFVRGDILALDGARLWSAGSARFVGIAMGEPMSLRPAEAGFIVPKIDARITG